MKKLATLISILIVVLVSYWSFLDQQPQLSKQASTNTKEFSLEKALTHLRNISAEVHHVGSPGHKKVQRYIVSELENLGLTVEIQTQTVFNKKWAAGTTVENIITRVKGSQSEKALLLLSHYDSNPHSSFGASDAGSGVVTILEGVRAFLAKNQQPKNDIIIVISDAEELGLLGAQAFVNHHPWAKEVGLVLNFEARGSGGPSYMLLETNGKNGKLISEFNKAKVGYPAANSLMYSIYKKLPNDTDLTVFREDGNINGFNFAFIGDHFDYHTAQDTAERLDHKTLAHQADYLTKTLNYFAFSDLTNFDSDSDYVYVNFPFLKQLTFPFSWVNTLLILSILAFLVLLFFGLSLNRLNFKGIGKGFLVFVFSIFICGGVSYGLTKLLFLIHPSYQDILHGFTYNGYAYISGFVFLNLWILLLFYKRFGKDEKTANFFIAPIFVWLVINILIAVYLKGAGFFIIPVILALIILMIEVFMNLEKRFKKILFTLISIPTLYIFAPLVKMFPVGLGLKILFVSAILIALVFGLLLFTFQLKETRWPYKLTGVLCLGFFAAATFNSGYSEENKKPNSLVYIQNTEDGSAYFGTYNAVLDEFNSPYFTDNKKEGSIASAETKSKYNTRFRQYAKTENRKILSSSFTIQKDTAIGDERFVELVIDPSRKIHKYEFSATKAVSFAKLKVNGADVNRGKPYKVKGGTFLIYHMGNNDKNLKVSFTVATQEQVEFTINEISYDLLSHPKFSIKPRAKTMMPMPFVTNDAIIVTNEMKL